MQSRNLAKMMLKRQEKVARQLSPYFAALENISRFSNLGSHALEIPDVSRIANLPSVLQKDYIPMQSLTLASEKVFRIPAAEQVSKLLTEYTQKIGLHTRQASEAQRISEAISGAMASMQAPWLDSTNIPQSFNGFARLQEIAYALSTIPPFDPHLTEMLRTDLGDWRQEIRWPSEILDDEDARTTFYEKRGLNLDLAALPYPAFQQSLEVAGLYKSGMSPVHPNKGLDEEEDAGLERTNRAHEELLYFEIQLRQFIEKHMEEAFGPNWIKHHVPGQIEAEWKNKRDDANRKRRPPMQLIDYANFTDYVQIITCRDNWRKVFQCIFVSKESVLESFQRLYPIRNCTMHARPLNQYDELYLSAEITRLQKSMNLPN